MTQDIFEFLNIIPTVLKNTHEEGRKQFNWDEDPLFVKFTFPMALALVSEASNFSPILL